MAAKKAEKTKEERVRQEKNRLNRVYKEIPDNKKKAVAGLIDQLAAMRIELEDMIAELKESGWVEQFRQSEKVEAYERQRPLGQTYLSMCGLYGKSIKQLTDLLPTKEVKQTDGFDEFLAERDLL